MILIGHDQVVADWVAKAIKKQFCPPYTAIGTVDADGRLTGGAVFTNYTGDAVELSIAGGGVVNRAAWRAIAHYVFEQMGCSRLTIHTSAKNKRVRRMAPKFGFVFEGTARNLYGSVNGLCYSLVRDDISSIKQRWRL